MNKKYVIGLLINVILTIIGLTSVIVLLPEKNQAYFVVTDLVTILIYVLIVYYSIRGYKIPHGNLLRYLMLACCIYLIFYIINSVKLNNYIDVILSAIVLLCYGYNAGRLDKINKNQIIFIAVLAIQIASLVITLTKGEFTFWMIISLFNPLIISLDLIGAYFSRYAEHREAGLQDK